MSVIERRLPNGGTIRVRRATVADRLNLSVITYRLQDTGVDMARRYAVQRFARFATQTEQCDGFAMPDVSAEPDVLRAAFEAWLRTDAALYDAWESALTEADAPVDVATAPEPLAGDADPN